MENGCRERVWCRVEFSLINLLLVLLVAWVSGSIVSRLGYPAILGELAAGVLFGPPLLGWIHDSSGLKALSEVGVFLLMLYIGMEVKSRDLLTVSKTALAVAIGGFFLPFVLGVVAAVAIGISLVGGLFIGLAMGVTSLATKSRILLDLNLLGTRLASVMLAAALICDTIALVVFAVITGLADEEGLNLSRLALVTVKALLFFGFSIWIGVRIFPRIGQLMRRLGFTERTANFTLVIMIGLVFAELAELAGLHAMVGAFLAGMFLREEVLQRKLSSEVTTLVHDLSIGFLAPIFFVSAGFLVDVSVIFTHWRLLVALVALAVFGKLVGTMLAYRPLRTGWREGLVVGLGMNDRGAVEIIVAQLALKAGLIDETVFTILVAIAIVTTCMTPISLRWGARWLRRRGELAPAEDHRAGVLIAGAGPLACAVARELAVREPVQLVDSNPGRCRAAEAQGLSASVGDALEEATLERLDADHVRVFLAMTSNTQVNQLSIRQARTMFGIAQCYAISGGVPMYPLDTEFGQWNIWIGAGETDRTIRTVETADVAAMDWCQESLSRDEMPLVVIRGDRVDLPVELGRLKAGDQVVVARRIGVD